MGPMDLRPAAPAEMEWVARMVHDHLGPIVNSAWRDPQGSHRVLDYVTGAGCCFIATVDERDVGFIHLDVTRDQLHVGALVVEPRLRSRGLGRRMLAWAEGRALELGMPQIGLWVETNNPRAIRLYRTLGYEPAGSPRDNTLAMVKEVLPPPDRMAPQTLAYTMGRAARAAGEVIRRHFQNRRVVAQKTARDVLTEADLAAERTVLAELDRSYADFNLYAEESGARQRGSDFTWVVDPLDGTNNFVLGIPYFAVSIALMRSGQPWMGVTYQPMLREMFTARAGAGAWCDARPLRCGAAPPLGRAVLSWVQGHPVGPDHPEAEPLQHRAERCCRRMMRTWAPSLDWCLLARGEVHGLISFDSEPEDQFAGALIAGEAGAVIADFNGRPWQPGAARILAACSPELHAELWNLL